MRSGNVYRFSLQFGADTESKTRAGELLERLGNKKSAVIVAALNDYLENHPELESDAVRIKVEEHRQLQRDQLEAMIRGIVLEQMQTSSSFAAEVIRDEQQNSLDQDIATMLNNLDFFQ